jgi:hypothetical protein
MMPSEIRVGRTYRNRGKGRTTRTVVSISGDETGLHWYSMSPRPKEPVVQFTQGDKTEKLYISSFASWAGSEVMQ